MKADEEDYYEERAAIREYDGGQTRQTAERGAREDLARWMERSSVQPKLQTGEDQVNKQGIVLKFREKYGMQAGDLMVPIEKAINYAYEQGEKAAGSRQAGSGGDKPAKCKKCEGEIVFGLTKNGKKQPMDATPVTTDPGGKLYKLRNGEVWFVKDDWREKEIAAGVAMTCHFDTCSAVSHEPAPAPAPKKQDTFDYGPPPMEDDVAF